MPSPQKPQPNPHQGLINALKKNNPKLHTTIAASQYDMMKYLNGRIAQVKVGSKVRYFDRLDADITFYAAIDMALVLGEQRVWTWKEEVKPAFPWWQGQDDRAQYSRVIFEPDTSKVRDGELNLFRGFAITPARKIGGWDRFKDHLFHNICSGSSDHYAYLVKWLAHLFQRPGQKIGVALVLQGEMGTGKSFLGEYLAYCLGRRHCPAVDTPEGLTGKHNRHLAEALVIRAEEALHAKDPRHVSRIKHLITGGTFIIEPKGVDAFEIESKANLIFTTNSSHVVAAGAAERRYFCLRVSNRARQDRPYFKAIDQEMRNGGAAAFMFDMMKINLVDFDVTPAPATDLLASQIMESMVGLERWWAEVLSAGRLPWRGEAQGHLPQGLSLDEADALLEWPETGAWKTHRAVVSASAADHIRTYQGPPTPEAVGRFLGSAVPGLQRSRSQERGDRHHTYIFPPLDDCRRAFIEARPGLTIECVGGKPNAQQASEKPGPEAAKGFQYRRSRPQPLRRPDQANDGPRRAA